MKTTYHIIPFTDVEGKTGYNVFGGTKYPNKYLSLHFKSGPYKTEEEANEYISNLK